MSIFNFIYCYFYDKYGRSGPGRFTGSSFVLIAIGLYIMTILEIIYVITDYKITFFFAPRRDVTISLEAKRNYVLYTMCYSGLYFLQQ